MNKRMKLITCALLSTLMLAVATPMAAHAGTLTIYNKNCTKLKGLKTHKRVTVHVFAPEQHGCTNTYVTVDRGSQKMIELKDMYENKACKYAHNAKGTVLGHKDVLGTGDSNVTCKKDWADVCQCTED